MNDLQEILSKLEVDMNSIREAVKANDEESFWVCVEDLETTASDAISNRSFTS